MIKRYTRLNAADGIEAEYGVKSKEYMNLYNGIERRRSKRVAYPFEIWYKDHNKNYQGFKHAYGKDISEHGLLFETYESFPPCTILEIRLELPSPRNSNESFNILAEVVRSEEIKHQWLYHIGIAFCRIDESCQKFLREYILRDRCLDRRELIGTT